MTNEDDRPLDNLEELLAGLPDPEPSPPHRDELRRRVLETFDRTAPNPESTPWRRAIQTGVELMRHPVSRFAMACAFMATAAVWLLAPTKSFAIGDLIAPIVEAKSAKFQLSVKTELQPAAMIGTGYFLAPNRIRQEFPAMTSVADFDQGRMVTLVPMAKQAFIIKTKGKRDPDRPTENYFANLRSTLARYKKDKDKAGQVKELGEKQVDGRKVVGFQLAMPGQLTTIWGDAATGLPTRIEAETAGSVKTEVVFSDIQFDLDLDEKLFAIEPPADYSRVEAELDVTPPVEKDFVAALDRLVAMNDGDFPTGFDATGLASAFSRSAMKSLANGGKADDLAKKMMVEGVQLGRGLSFATQLPREADARYAGAKVKRDGPKVPVFWYKPAGASRHRVIWSDLTTTEAETAPNVEGAVGVYPVLPKGAAK